jgi:hypothetical protein
MDYSIKQGKARINLVLFVLMLQATANRRCDGWRCGLQLWKVSRKEDKEQGCSVSQGISSSVTYAASLSSLSRAQVNCATRQSVLSFLHKGQGTRLQILGAGAHQMCVRMFFHMDLC